MPKANKELWEKMREKYGKDGDDQVPKEWRAQAVAEYRQLGGKLVPAGQENRGKTLKAPK